MIRKYLLGSFIFTIILFSFALFHSGVSAAQTPRPEYNFNLAECNNDFAGVSANMGVKPVKSGTSNNYGFLVNFDGMDFADTNFNSNDSTNPNAYTYNLEVFRDIPNRRDEKVYDRQITDINNILIEGLPENEGYVFQITKNVRGGNVTECVYDNENSILLSSDPAYLSTVQEVSLPNGETTTTSVVSGGPTSSIQGTKVCNDPNIPSNSVGMSWGTQVINEDPYYSDPNYYLNYDLDLTNAPTSSVSSGHKYVVRVVDATTGQTIDQTGKIDKDSVDGTFSRQISIQPSSQGDTHAYKVEVDKIIVVDGNEITDSNWNGFCESDDYIAVASEGDTTGIGGPDGQTNTDPVDIVGNPVDATPPPEVPDTQIKELVSKIYVVVLPIAIIIAVIKILLALVGLATSSGDPQKLGQAKEEILATILGLLIIVGAVSFINILGSALGL